MTLALPGLASYQIYPSRAQTRKLSSRDAKKSIQLYGSDLNFPPEGNHRSVHFHCIVQSSDQWERDQSNQDTLHTHSGSSTNKVL